MESVPGGLVIKYRVDGVLARVGGVQGTELAEQAVSRLKVLAELDIAERRVPQDGRFKVQAGGRAIDFRVSIMPSIHGEDAVLRILDKEHLTRELAGLSLDTLGFDATTRARLRHMAAEPYGMLLVTGPTGSGKTTSLYALLSETHTGQDKVITIEDPVEYQLPGVLQIPVNERKGLTFARGLRSILRHDPDRVMVGEIRDAETAQIAVQAALTGHLVFSTLHTNDSASAITRLADLGVPPYLISATVIGVLAQRLARTLCPACKVRDGDTNRETLDGLAQPWRLGGGLRPHKAVGCLACRNTGFRGRVGLYELMVMDDAARRAVHPAQDMAALRRQALAEGMRALRLAGLMKVAEGSTTVDEILRATPAWQEN